MDHFTRTERTTLKRLPARGTYDRRVVYQILDEGFICHVGFSVKDQPFVIPTGYARLENQLYLHGSKASRMLRVLKTGLNVCISVTLVDGLVLARSAFHHSINYRSVVLLGQVSTLDKSEDKLVALRTFSEHMLPGRWHEVRQPTAQELQATTVLSLPLNEASAKVRTGPPIDDEEDYALPVWAGVIPLRIEAGAPIPDPRLKSEIKIPPYASHYSRNPSEE